MRARKIVVEVICIILLMYFFYDGIYKVAYWSKYALWMKYAPLLKPVWQFLSYVVPVGEIVLALALFSPKFRMRALYISIAGLISFLLWVVITHLFTHRLFWPYHAIWGKSTWMQVMLVSLGMCWISFTAIILSRPNVYRNRSTLNSLRNTSANVSR